jgi:hypothetical protein
VARAARPARAGEPVKVAKVPVRVAGVRIAHKEAVDTARAGPTEAGATKVPNARAATATKHASDVI